MSLHLDLSIEGLLGIITCVVVYILTTRDVATLTSLKNHQKIESARTTVVLNGLKLAIKRLIKFKK